MREQEDYAVCGNPRAFVHSEKRIGPCVAISSGEKQSLGKDLWRAHEIFMKVAFLSRVSNSFRLRFKQVFGPGMRDCPRGFVHLNEFDRVKLPGRFTRSFAKMRSAKNG